MEVGCTHSGDRALTGLMLGQGLEEPGQARHDANQCSAETRIQNPEINIGAHDTEKVECKTDFRPVDLASRARAHTRLQDHYQQQAENIHRNNLYRYSFCRYRKRVEQISRINDVSRRLSSAQPHANNHIVDALVYKPPAVL